MPYGIHSLIGESPFAFRLEITGKVKLLQKDITPPIRTKHYIINLRLAIH
jgi:hypothetical protein